VTLPAENQQTVEDALNELDGELGYGQSQAARAALRDLVAQAAIGREVLEEFADIGPDSPLYLIDVRNIARDALARLDGAR
jgi:hypothetical protein